MKKPILLIFICLLCIYATAQPGNDSLAYQLQRNRINQMLAQRTQKFGQYDSSLSEHSGIFGWQTKKDIRRSNDILMDIVKTDDAIYKELKILLEYRTFQQTQVQSKSQETEDSNMGFMRAINQLRQQNDRLKADAEKAFQQQQKTTQRNIIIFILMFVSILFLLTRIRWRKA